MRENGPGKFYIYKIALVASIGGFLFGYDLVIISGALPLLEQSFALTPALKGFAVSSAILGAISGPLVGLWCADRLGRRKTMMLASFFFMISAIGSGVAVGIWDFGLWRFMGGVGIGLAMMSSPIYIAELAPPQMRGVLVNVNQLSNVIGINLAVIAGYFFSFDGWGWRWMMYSEAVPVVFLVLGLLVIPESPRWLVAQRRNGEALGILEKINGRKRAEEELAEIHAGLQQEVGGEFREVFQPGIKTAFIIGTILMIFSQINGVNMMLLYAPTIMAEAGVSMGSGAILSSIPVYVVILICTLLAFPLIKRFSRRGLLITSVSLMAFGHLVMALNLYQGWPPMFTLIPMFIGTGAFTLGFAPLSWIIVSEIFPTRIRSKALAVVCFFLYLSSFLIAQFFPSLTDYFTRSFGNAAGVYVMFAIICAACVWFSWKKVPETKGLSLEEIGRFWRKNSAESQPEKNGVPERV
ncbi:sugar porter family MFS transporter [Chitinophaga deserti]|uniref:sugar porter family MFS transporter n=1 Tax=Chitinophaga deserti TaxID=2164099 RepID=UPI000D6AEB8F|nr:sugar porter family MFS transporter [Chitinophaga deserti]